MTSTNSVLTPSSSEELIAALAADPEATIIGGGTLVVPQHSLGAAVVERALWLGRAGLDSVTEADGGFSVGGAASLAACRALPAPLGQCAANIGDPEVQAQATIGGNICSPAPYGDLRGPLLALEATIRSATAAGERIEDAASFFAEPDSSVVLEIRFTSPAAGAFVPLQRPHTQSLTAIGVSAVKTAAGEVKLAVTGMAPDARRLTSAEAALAGGADAATVAAAADQDIAPYDDVLASAAYRRRVFPTLLNRAIEQLGG